MFLYVKEINITSIIKMSSFILRMPKIDVSCPQTLWLVSRGSLYGRKRRQRGRRKGKDEGGRKESGGRGKGTENNAYLLFGIDVPAHR